MAPPDPTMPPIPTRRHTRWRACREACGMDGKAPVLLPALNGANVLLQESGNFLPGVELRFFAFSPGIFPTVSHRLGSCFGARLETRRATKKRQTAAPDACRPLSGSTSRSSDLSCRLRFMTVRDAVRELPLQDVEILAVNSGLSVSSPHSCGRCGSPRNANESVRAELTRAAKAERAQPGSARDCGRSRWKWLRLIANR